MYLFLTNVIVIVLIVFGGYVVFMLYSNNHSHNILKNTEKITQDFYYKPGFQNKPSIFYFFSIRLLDIMFSIIALLIVIPIFIIIAILIKIESKGPVFYAQHRIGLNGKVVRYYKFRTMFAPDYERNNEMPKNIQNGVTRIGKFLRKTAIDEMPGFFNVLRGDFSIIGRSRILDYKFSINYLTDEQKQFLLMLKPGLVSLWSISHARLDGKFDIMPLYDLYYLQHRSLLFDLKIILNTLPFMFGMAASY